ncbi:carbohydrate porin [Frateuria aurantia]
MQTHRFLTGCAGLLGAATLCIASAASADPQTQDDSRSPAPSAERKPSSPHADSKPASTHQHHYQRGPHQQSTPVPHDGSSRKYLTGDWGGLRSRLLDKGIALGADYQSESAFGGGYYGSAYTHQIAIEADFDLARLWNWTGSTFHFKLGERAGHDLGTQRLGTLIQTQEIYGVGQDVRLYAMNYEYTSPKQGFDLMAGRVTVGNQFGHQSQLCQFEALVFCGHPLTLSSDSGWINSPKATWGIRAKFATPLVYGQFGVYTVDPTYNRASRGFMLSFAGTTGVVMPLEIGITPGVASNHYPGHYFVGAYYDTSSAPDVYLNADGQSRAIYGGKAKESNSRSGWYIYNDQVIWQPASNPDRQLSLFADFSEGDRATAKYSQAWMTGAVFQGPFASRPQDLLAIGVGKLTVNPRLQAYDQQSLPVDDAGIPVETFEKQYEINYSLWLRRWLMIRPGVEYIDRPGGLIQRPGIWLGNLTLKVVF